MLSYIQIKSFIELCEAGSFSKAAKSLSTTQPTMTKRIQQIESFINKSLLIRQRNSTYKDVVLTEHGRDFLYHAKVILRNYESLDNAFLATDKIERLRIHTVKVIFHTLLSDYGKMLSELYPYLKLTFEIHGDNVLKDFLKKDIADMVFLVGDQSSKEIRSDFIMQCEMGWFVNKELYKKVKKFSSARDVFGSIKLIMCAENYVHAKIVEESFLENDIGNYIMEYTPHMDTMIELVRQGFGIGFLPKAFVEWNNENRIDKLLKLDLIPVEGLSFYSAILRNSDKMKYYDLLLEMNGRRMKAQ